MAGPKRSHESLSASAARPGPGRRAAERQVGGELGDLVDGHVARQVQRVAEVGGQLDGRVHGERRADAAAQAGALQERRRLDRATAHEHVTGVDGDRRARRRPWRGRGWHGRRRARGGRHGARARRRAPAEVGTWQVRLGHALAPPVGRRRAAWLVRHPPRDLVVTPAEAGRAAAQGVAGRRRRRRVPAAPRAPARPRRRSVRARRTRGRRRRARSATWRRRPRAVGGRARC